MVDKAALISNFSRYAHTYDRYANLQKLTGCQLLKLLSSSVHRAVLEIGCGTGNYTMLLRDKFPAAKLQAVDISPGMIKIASEKFKKSEVEFIVADAERLDLKQGYDLITSNACFQWFNNFEGALKKYKGAINSGGYLVFSLFGPETFKELKECLRAFGFTNNSVNFISQEKLRSNLAVNFQEIRIREVIYQETFSSLRGLFEKIRYTGIRGSGAGNKSIFTPGMLKKIEAFYLGRFKEIKATYQVFYCKGVK